jgi:hypothetical protein
MQNDESEKNVKNPDFLWEVPKDDGKQRTLQEVQEVIRPSDDSGNDTNTK